MQAEAVQKPKVPGQTKVLIVASTEGASLQRLIEEQADLVFIGLVADPRWALQAARETQPDVVLVCLGPLAGAAATAALAAGVGFIPVVAISAQAEPDYEQEAAAAGATYLSRPVSQEKLLACLHRLGPRMSVPAAGTAMGLNSAPARSPSQPAGGALGATTASRPAAGADEVPGAGRITMVLGAKGGVGKTTLALGLAAALNQGGAGRVALVDLDLQFGDVALMLGVQPAKSMADVAALLGEDGAVDAMLIGSMMPNYNGIRLLCAPPAPEQADTISPECIRSALEIIRPAFDDVVVDCSAHFGDEVLEAVDLADRVLLVSDLSIGSIKETKLCLSLLPLLGVPRTKLYVVLNRVGGDALYTVDQVQAHLGCPASALIPENNLQALEAIKRNVPIIAVEPNSDLTQAIFRMASGIAGRQLQLSGASAKPAAKRSLWAAAGLAK